MAERVNLACGDVYLPGWLNLDYVSTSEEVCRADLLKRLPLSDCAAKLVYSSHFLEHVPRNKIGFVIDEVFRITQSGGRVRLVVPDLEELCATYLSCRRKEQHVKADFVMLEMIDQCVRTFPGGELGAYYGQLQRSGSLEMVDYVRERTGHVISLEHNSASVKRRSGVALPNLKEVLLKLERLYCRAVIALLPTAVRRQNVSLARVGERHAWIYDFHTIEQILLQAGFSEVQRLTASTSTAPDFPFYPLDLDADGNPRKGVESMYIEAVKP